MFQSKFQNLTTSGPEPAFGLSWPERKILTADLFKVHNSIFTNKSDFDHKRGRDFLDFAFPDQIEKVGLSVITQGRNFLRILIVIKILIIMGHFEMSFSLSMIYLDFWFWEVHFHPSKYPHRQQKFTNDKGKSPAQSFCK